MLKEGLRFRVKCLSPVSQREVDNSANSDPKPQKTLNHQRILDPNSNLKHSVNPHSPKPLEQKSQEQKSQASKPKPLKTQNPKPLNPQPSERLSAEPWPEPENPESTRLDLKIRISLWVTKTLRHPCKTWTLTRDPNVENYPQDVCLEGLRICRVYRA